MRTKFIITTRPESKYRNPGEKYCFRVVNIPVSEIVPDKAFSLEDFQSFRADILVFTSSVGASIFLEKFGKSAAGDCQILCIGRDTAEPFLSSGMKVTLPESFDSKGLIRLIGSKFHGSRIALLRSDRANSELTDFLSAHYYEFRDFILYRLKGVESDLAAVNDTHCAGILITSSFEASIVIDYIERERTRIPNLYAIGSTTAEFLDSKGYRVAGKVPNSNFLEALAEIEKDLCRNKK